MILESAAPAMLAFVLGGRHGLDADHLAAIDGLTRWNAGAGRRFAPWCGVLFSAGHAGVILGTAVALASIASHFTPPTWFALLGTVISAVTLIVLGSMNLHAALSRSTGDTLPGLRSRLLGSVLHAGRPWEIAVVGALFALSFDAIAIAALFASSAGRVTGVLASGLSFAAGMLTVGAANGLWVVRLLSHSSDSSWRAARVMTLTIALATFAVAVRVLLSLVGGRWDRLAEDYELLLSGSVVTLVFTGYVTSLAVAGCSRPGQNAALTGTADIAS